MIDLVMAIIISVFTILGGIVSVGFSVMYFLLNDYVNAIACVCAACASLISGGLVFMCIVKNPY